MMRLSPMPLLRTSFAGSRSSFSTSARLLGYEDTIQNLKIGAHTRVIFQGFTGRQATANAKESLAWGTNIVGGVTPGKTAEHLGLPVLPTVKKAMEILKPDVTGIYVAAHQAAAAIEEAIEAEVPLIVAVAEHIPIHDIMRLHSILNTQSKSRLVGANSPGIISAIGKCRIGFQPLPCFTPGRVGIVAKSGTLSYEAVASTTRSGLGQSLCIGMGGDVIAGTNFVDALKIFEEDGDTDGIVLIGEIGGFAELEAAEWIKEYKTRSSNPKPIAALVGGAQVTTRSFGKVMGHAGAFTFPGDPDVSTKVKHLQDAGVAMVNHPAKFGEVMKQLLRGDGQTSRSNSSLFQSQRRTIHSQTLWGSQQRFKGLGSKSNSTTQKRMLHLGNDAAKEFLKKQGISIARDQNKLLASSLAIAIDRSTRTPCILVSNEEQLGMKRFPFKYRESPTLQQLEDIAALLNFTTVNSESLSKLINNLIMIHLEKELVILSTQVVETSRGLEIVQANLVADDAAFRSAHRQEDIQSLRDIKSEDPQELQAANDGIVYVKLEGEGNIGTLVNGAGLAMNTVDALADAGGKATNFLDTGGKATSETVKQSFRLILQDPRVKVIFVNIFGGLTLGDMIANGIILAFSELKISLPVVVRIRGTNEREGQKIISESGLPLYAFDDFEEAATKAIELANSS